jgi:tetratricopeptide (TPR) repeat protein
MLKTTNLLALVAVALTATSCALFRPSAVHENYDPAERLETCLQAWEVARAAETGAMDADEARSEIRGLMGLALSSEEIRFRIMRIAFDYPDDIRVLMANAAVAYDAGDMPSAQQYADRVLKAEPAYPAAAILRSRIALREGNLPYAKKLLEDQIKLSPDHGEMRSAYAGLLFLGKDYDAAREALADARRLGAEEWRIAYNRGLVEEAAGNFDEARRQFSITLELNPDYRPAMGRLAALRGR